MYLASRHCKINESATVASENAGGKGLTSNHQWCPSAVILGVYFGMIAENILQYREVVRHCRPVQRCPPILRAIVSKEIATKKVKKLTASLLLASFGSWERRDLTRPAWPSCAARCTLREDMVVVMNGGMTQRQTRRE